MDNFTDDDWKFLAALSSLVNHDWDDIPTSLKDARRTLVGDQPAFINLTVGDKKIELILPDRKNVSKWTSTSGGKGFRIYATKHFQNLMIRSMQLFLKIFKMRLEPFTFEDGRFPKVTIINASSDSMGQRRETCQLAVQLSSSTRMTF